MKSVIGVLIISFLLFSNGSVAHASISINKKAPEFTLEGYSTLDSQKQIWSSEELRGKWIVLYFYPKDFTSGCTIEAKGFEKLYESFKKQDAYILGISSDDIDNHKSFCSKQRLRFPLLTDKDGMLSKAYNSWGAETPNRNTFLIDPNGILRYKWTSPNPVSHAQNVLTQLLKIQS